MHCQHRIVDKNLSGSATDAGFLYIFVFTMLNAAIILTAKTDPGFMHSLQGIQGVEWHGVYSPGHSNVQDPGNTILFSSAEILPKIADLLIVLHPEFCNFEYLSGAIRNGCHLFLMDKLKLNFEERKALIYLAKEGNTYIEVKNSLTDQSLKKNLSLPEKNGTCFIEITDIAPFEEGKLEKRLINNLHLIFRTCGVPIQRSDIFCGSAPMLRPDIIHIHIKFINGSTASLKLIFNEQELRHEMKIYHEKGLSKYNLLQNAGQDDESESLKLFEQIQDFISTIQTKTTPFFGLTEEMEIYLLMKKIREKFDLHSVMY
jgi:hypothetical protein